MIKCQHQNAVGRRHWIAGAMVAAGIALGCVAAPGSASALPSPTLISACGYKISTPGFYRVTGTITWAAAPNEPCIDITASGKTSDPVILEIANTNTTENPCASTTITGNNSAASPVGILIEKSASDVFIAGGNSNVAGWQNGIENYGDGTTIENINISNNSNAGIINQSQGTFLTNLFSGILQNSKNADCFADTPVGSAPQNYGVEFNGASGSTLFLATLSGNSLYGSWFDQTDSSDIIFTGSAAGTGGTTAASFFFGCDGSANIGTPCSGGGAGNFVYSDLTSVFTFQGKALPGSTPYGIALQDGETNDTFTDNQATGSTFDIYSQPDLDNNCGSSNTFFFNQVDNVEPPCLSDIN
jgi:hypothetical protein